VFQSRRRGDREIGNEKRAPVKPEIKKQKTVETKTEKRGIVYE
jgi:hypothetical protein